MSSCHGLISMHYILYDVIVLMSSYDVIGSALDVMLWNQQWNHVYETHFCACALARFCCGFRGVAVHYNEGSSPRIRPSSPSSLATAPSSSAQSSPSPRLATERRPAKAPLWEWGTLQRTSCTTPWACLEGGSCKVCCHGPWCWAWPGTIPRTVPQVSWCRNDVIFAVDAIVVGLLANEHQNVLAWRSPAKRNKNRVICWAFMNDFLFYIALSVTPKQS